MNSYKAAAKLNLFLHITGKREDGYHFLQSLAVFVDICDRITCQEADTLTLSIKSERFPLDADTDQNLVMKAAQLLQSSANTCKGAALHLEKYIPVGAGMGGGSADAALTLQLLNRHWQLGLTQEDLWLLATQLGSDVCACLNSTPVWMEGVGEQLTPVTLPKDLWFVVIYPNIVMLSKDVYAQHRYLPRPPYPINPHLDHARLIELLAHTHNDLTGAALSLHPMLQEVLNALERRPECQLSRMSGSGSACFGLFSSQAAAEQAANYLQAMYPEWWIKAAGHYIP